MTLQDLYTAELQEILDGEQQWLQELPALIASATSAVLRDALLRQVDEARIHLERVELALRKLGAASAGSRCDGMYGVLQEARRRTTETERGAVLDAALIGVAAKAHHYEIAAYECAQRYARALNDADAVKLWRQTIDDKRAAYDRLTQIAKRGIGEAADEGASLEHHDTPGGLRYLSATQLHDFKYREFRVRNAAGEDLGSLDGLIVDTESDLPQYFVIDSGGWFVGQRFLVPIDALRPDEATQTLRTDLDRKTIEAHPPFNPDAFSGRGAASNDLAVDEKYRPPTWLMTGVWMTEASGFASVPPRAQSDFNTSPASDSHGERRSDR